MGSPFTALICKLLADGLDLTTSFGRRIIEWPQDPKLDALSLRGAGGLNYLGLSGQAPQLTSLYPPNQLPDAASLWAVLSEVIRERDDFLTTFLDSPPQTNEVSRSAGILAGGLAVAAQRDLPLEVFEIGASAGLNLWFDRYRYDYGSAGWGDEASPVFIRCDWSGPLPELNASLRVTARHGCDQRPLNPASAEDRLRLLCYVWPDQIERVARIRAALELAALDPPVVEKADAADWVEHYFRELKPGVVKVLVNTVVWQYLDDETRSRITRAMERAGSLATAGSGLAWLQLEYDGGGKGGGLHVRQWPGGEDRLLARFDFHGRWAEGSAGI